jgi:hypothetical protein
MVPPNMALQRTRRPRLRSGRSLRSLGSPLNARPLGGRFLLVVSTILLGVAGCASHRYGRVEGVVRDQGGGALPGTVVTLESTQTRRVVTADLRGHFAFSSLPAGTYALRFELTSFVKPSPRTLEVARGGSQFLSLVLDLPPPQPVTVGEDQHFLHELAERPRFNLGLLPRARTLADLLRSKPSQ